LLEEVELSVPRRLEYGLGLLGVAHHEEGSSVAASDDTHRRLDGRKSIMPPPAGDRANRIEQ
jgi:hypothetical protein